MAAFSAGLLALVIVAAIVVNSGAFNLVAKNRIESLFNDEFKGRLELREVRLSFPDRVTIVAPSVFEESAGAPALAAGKIDLRFNFLSLLKPKLTTLSFQELNADGFSGRIVTESDGKLNIQKIFTKRDPNKPKTLDIETFRCRKVSIRNASLLYAPLNAPSYDLRGLNLDVSRLIVGKKELRGAMGRLQFSMPDRGFRLRKGSGSIVLSPKSSEVIGLILETDKSSAKLSASFDGLDLLSGISFQKLAQSQVFVHIDSTRLHTDDLNQFRAIPKIPAGLYTVKGDARGTLGDLHIMPTVVDHGQSHLAFQGEILNISDLKNLSFRMQFDKSRLSADFLEQVAEKENLKKLAKESGDIEFSGLLQGKPDQWLTDVAFKSGLGSGSMAVNAKKLAVGRYSASGTFALENTTPHRLFGLQKVSSGFSGSGSFSGAFSTSGSVESAHLEAAFTNAFWQQQRVSSGSVILDYTPLGVSTTANLQHTDGSALSISGSIDLSSKSPSYQAAGSMRRLDLSKAGGASDFTTNLNGSFDIKGQGFDPASLNVHADMVFAPSSVNDFQIQDRSTVSVGVVQSPASTSITLASSFMDLSLQGNASLYQVLGTIRLASSSIAKELGRPAAPPVSVPELPSTPFAFDYRLTVRDIAPLAPLLGTKELRFQGSTSGKASFADGQLSMDSDYVIGNLESGQLLRFGNATFKTTLQCSRQGVSSASVAGMSATASVAGKEMRSVQIRSSFGNNLLNASLDLSVPEYGEKLSAVIQARRNGPQTAVVLNKLTLTSPSGVWQATPDATMDVASSYIRFNRLGLTKGPQIIEFDGLLSSSQPGTFQCRLSNIELGELRQFIPDSNLSLLSGRVNALVSVSGAPGAKTSSLELRGSNVALDDIRIGSLHLTADHSGDRLRFNLDSRNPAVPAGSAQQQSINTITGSGSLPLILSFSPFRIELPERRPLEVSFHSNDLSAKFLVFALSLLDDADGIIPTDLRITGSFPRPDIFLTARMSGTRIRVAPTQVSYLVNGQVTGTPSRLDIGSLTFSDGLQGTGTVSGFVKLDGFKPISFDLSATCNDLLLYSKKDMKDDTSFGIIRGTTNRFHFFGDISAPTAEGEFNVTSADFSLYRKGSNESAKYIGVEKFIEFVPRYPSRTTTPIAKNGNVERTPQFRQNLLDILQISSLRLTCNVPLRGTMIFDRIRGERLESTINNLSLNVSKTRQRYNLFGTVDIIGGKYTLSNSYFDLESGGRVIWNNEEIRDGALENLNGTKLISASDTQTGERDNVKLLLAIGGTINEPNVRMGYYLNDDLQPYSSSNTIGRQTSHIDPNADLNVISMLLSRQWYLNPERQGRSGNLPVSTVGVSAGTGMLSSQLSGLVQGLAGVESFNVNVGTSNSGALKGVELNFAMLVPGTGGKVRFIGTGSTPTGTTSTSTNNYYGSSQKLEYRVNQKVYVQAYRSYGQTGVDGTSTNLQTPTENWGASVSYKERFHTWGQFWNRLFGKKEKKE